MTTAVILETGFLSNYNDRLIIVDNPDLSTEGLTNGILKYLSNEKLI
jgi:N-acetylmuramoyl-L-alanine amidase